MKISILTLFPEMFKGPFEYSIIKNAQAKGLVEIEIINIRDFGIGRHQVVDDTPYGGGIGMVMRVDILHKAIEHVKKHFKPFNHSAIHQRVILMSASGKKFNQTIAKEYASLDHLILICGHYEGVDARIKNFIDAEISIGDFVLTGGELPAMLITDSVTRLIKGVLKDGVTENESFSLKSNGNSQLEYPQFTKPPVYENSSVPEVLLSGDHKKIEEWRLREAVKITKEIRPDLLHPKE